MSSQQGNYIANEWQDGKGSELISLNPATQATLWRGKVASKDQVTQAIIAAHIALAEWQQLTVDVRCQFLDKFAQTLAAQQAQLADVLSQETGKPLWEAKTEITAMINKLDVCKDAYAQRCKTLTKDMQGVTSITRHKAHGVVVVLGPFNFPGHLPNGHIIPALLAGNTVVFKPSELTPLFSIKMLECWQAAQLPKGVLNMVLGAGEIGQALIDDPTINGIFFTGSYNIGHKINTTSLNHPRRIVALEMGGNNPLIVHQPDNIDGAVYHTIQSAFITAGQRCTCARRLIVVKSSVGEQFVQRLIEVTKNLKIGSPSDKPEPFMGPVISNQAAEKILAQYNAILKFGAEVLLPLVRLQPELPFLSPSIIDVTDINIGDEEIFGPLLRLTWVNDFDAAIKEANNTQYGLVAGLLCGDESLYQTFLQNINAGVVSWNRPTTGASSSAPFGGTGKSGNYRPSAYYAADYCAYPVASLEDKKLTMPASLSPGITL